MNDESDNSESETGQEGEEILRHRVILGRWSRDLN